MWENIKEMFGFGNRYDEKPKKPAYYIDECTYSDGSVEYALYCAGDDWVLSFGPNELEEYKATCYKLNNPVVKVSQRTIYP